MSAVFEFDDLPSSIKKMSIEKEEQPTTESGYSSDIDATEPRTIPLDEKTYEVPLHANFISSSIKTSTLNSNGILNTKKVTLEDFEILKLLGRGA